MKKVTLSHAESRYRWGQFTITEPSRFLEEIDENLIDKPKKARINTLPDFRKVEKRTLDKKFKSLGSNSQPPSTTSEAAHFEASDTTGLQTGMTVEHPKFGKGKVVAVEGSGPNKKATVYFAAIGNKNLLLRFAKLKILS
jgi:DNA helicase-2/ATP-dependent DNA helicase PcrA